MKISRFVEEIDRMIHWRAVSFEKLSLVELYELMALRQEVFVVEQDCPYLDADGKDFDSHHVMGYDSNMLVACTRIVAPGISYDEVSLGRIVTKPSVRGKGHGIALMQFSHQMVKELYGDVPIRISAQCYLEKFYKNLGYEATGKEYLEDGIPHMEMLRKVH